MLSKKEYRYRLKIIAENHLHKEIQKHLDAFVSAEFATYKSVYLSEILLYKIIHGYSLWCVGKAFYKVGCSAKQATFAFKELGKTLQRGMRE